MVSSKQRLVEHDVRVEGTRTLREYGPGATLRLNEPDVSLDVDAVYPVAFEDEPG